MILAVIFLLILEIIQIVWGIGVPFYRIHIQEWAGNQCYGATSCSLVALNLKLLQSTLKWNKLCN